MAADRDHGATTLLDRSTPSVSRIVPGRHINEPSSGSILRYAGLATVTTALAILFRSGYSFGQFDQLVHSLRGIALGDSAALSKDWFAQTVSQPHWLFDAVTATGTRLGVLPWVYLVYWLAGIAVFALASVWLVDRFLPGRRPLSLALGPLVAVGPTVILGSTTPLLWFAVPHMLGGCLALLSLAAVLSDRWRWAAVAALAAGAVHVQHGANLAPILLLAGILCTQAPRRSRAVMGGTALVLLAGAQLVAQWRGLQTAGDEWLTACREIIPGHCYAPSWSIGYLASGGFVVALAVTLAVRMRRSWQTVVPTIVLPAAGLMFGVVAERLQLGIFGRLAAEYNIHRLATIVEPMAALAILCLAARVTSVSRRRILWALGTVGALVIWLRIIDGAGSGQVATGAAIAIILTFVVLAFTVALPTEDVLRNRAGRLRRPMAAALAGTATVTLIAGATGALGHVGYDDSDPRVKVGFALREILPRDAIIAAPPETAWLRAISQRGVIADCKATPFGKEDWHEYWRRIESLGGICHGSGSGFAALRPEDIEALRELYGATHAFLYLDDPKLTYASQHWKRVYEAAAPPDGSVRMGVVVFDLTQLP